MKNNIRITKLHLYRTRFKGEEDYRIVNIDPLFSTLLRTDSLRSLKIEGNVDYRASCIESFLFFKYITGTTNLTSLKVISQNFNGGIVCHAMFAKALSCNTSIRKLQLSEMEFQSEDMEMMFGPKSKIKLTHLCLVDILIERSMIVWLCEYVKRGGLDTLILDEHYSVHPFILVLVECIANSTIKYLSMRDAMGNTRRLRKARDILEKNQTLTHITMFSKYIIEDQPHDLYDSFNHIARRNYMNGVTLFHLLEKNLEINRF